MLAKFVKIKKRMQLSLSLLSVVGVLLAPIASAQTVALAFEHTLAPPAGLDTLARIKMIVKNLHTGDVGQAAFFIQEKNMTEKNQAALDYYNESGQLVVNAGSRYHYLKRDTGYALPIDFLKANATFSNFTAYKGHIYIKHFPFSADVTTQTKITDFLSDHQFFAAYVTTVVNDGYLNKVLQKRLAANKTLDTRILEKIYAQLVLEKVNQRAAEFQFWLGYQPTQVVLLQESDVAAYGVLGLVDALNAAGYRVVSPEQVFSDPIGNPFFYNGFQQGGLMGYLMGVRDDPVAQPYVWTTADETRVKELITQEHVEFWYNTANE